MVTLVGAYASASGTSTITAPKVYASNVGAQSGDLILAHFRTSGNATVTAPSGWTLIRKDTGAGAGSWLFWKIRASGDPDPEVFTSGADYISYGYLCYRNFRTSNPIGASAGTVFATLTDTLTAPSVSAPVAGLVCRFFSGDNANSYTPASSWTTPSGHTERYDIGTAGYSSVAADDVALASAGTTGSAVATVSPAVHGVAQTVVISIPNTPPNAPALTSPAANATIDRTITQRFAWQFSDPDPGDTQSKFDLQYRTVGGSTWTAVTDSTPNAYWDAASGTFAAGDYEWQVRTYDATGSVGPWSASGFFTATNITDAPSIIAPTSGSTVSSNVLVEWSTTNQDAYQIRRVADDGSGGADTATVYYDSGEVASTSTRSQAIAFDTNNRWEHIEVRAKYNGLWSPWADIRVYVSFTPPAAPTLVVASDDAKGAVTVAFTNPTPGAGEPAVSYVNVYARSPQSDPTADKFRPYSDMGTRLAANKPTNSSLIDWSAASGVNYEYRAEAVATNGATSSSAWTQIDPAAQPTIYYGGGY